MSMVLAVAPRANLIVYEMNGAIPENKESLLAAIADDVDPASGIVRAQTISCSWSWETGTSDEIQAVQNDFQKFATQRQTFVISSGDLGSYVPTDPYNASFSAPQSAPQEPMADTVKMLTVGGTERQPAALGITSKRRPGTTRTSSASSRAPQRTA